jgi:hypothetical protein
VIDSTLDYVPNYGFDDKLEQDIPSRPAGLDGLSAVRGPVAGGGVHQQWSIGIVGIAGYGVTDPANFRLGAERSKPVCAVRVKTAWRRLGGGGLRGITAA